MEGSLVNKRDLLALYLSWTYCHKNGTRPPSCVTPRQLTIYGAQKIGIWKILIFFSEITRAIWQLNKLDKRWAQAALPYTPQL